MYSTYLVRFHLPISFDSNDICILTLFLRFGESFSGARELSFFDWMNQFVVLNFTTVSSVGDEFQTSVNSLFF